MPQHQENLYDFAPVTEARIFLHRSDETMFAAFFAKEFGCASLSGSIGTVHWRFLCWITHRKSGDGAASRKGSFMSKQSGGWRFSAAESYVKTMILVFAWFFFMLSAVMWRHSHKDLDMKAAQRLAQPAKVHGRIFRCIDVSWLGLFGYAAAKLYKTRAAGEKAIFNEFIKARNSGYATMVGNGEHQLSIRANSPKYLPPVPFISGSQTKNLIEMCRQGQVDDAFASLFEIYERGMEVPKSIFLRLMQLCANSKDVATGKRVHSLILVSRYHSCEFLNDHLIRMFACCGTLQDAKRIFHKVSKPSLYTWQAIISAHLKCGEGEEALDLYYKMRHSGLEANNHIYCAALQACTTVAAERQGREIHNYMVETGFQFDAFVGNTLVDMYAKFGNVEEARKVFDGLSQRDVVSWNAMISGYAEHGLGKEALALYEDMHLKDLTPNRLTYPSLLKACASIGALDEGRKLHERILECGLGQDVFVGSALVDMYAKCGDLEQAQRVFDGLSRRNIVTWNALVGGYAEHGLGQRALALYKDMQLEGLMPDSITFLCLLRACASTGALNLGMEIHNQILNRGMAHDILVGNTLVDMYAKCGNLKEARQVFDGLSHRNVISWNIMIRGYAENGQADEALTLFKVIQHDDLMPNRVTLLCLLKACSSLGALDEGREIHRQILNGGLAEDVCLGNNLVNMYAKCGDLEEARKVFDGLSQRDVVCWNVMILAYAEQGLGKEALTLHERMRRENLIPTRVTFLSLLKACTRILALEEGREIHNQVVNGGLAQDVFIGSTLVDMYAKCGSLEEARKVFDGLSQRNAVTWNAMIAGYAEHKLGLEALALYEDMQCQGMMPDSVTFVCLLKACASIGALHAGMQIHSHILDRGLAQNAFVGNTLVDMYSKCGNVKEARKVFDGLLQRDVVSWTAMIGGYAEHGLGWEALALYDNMRLEGMMPDRVTFVCLLTACSHAGLVKEGSQIFNVMSETFGITPDIEHYTCIVDLLGRAGFLERAEDIINDIQIPQTDLLWMCILRACRSYRNVELGTRAFDATMKLNPENAPAHALLSDIYAAAGMWDDQAELRKNIRRAGFKKTPGRTWVEVDNQVHTFTADDLEHPQRKTIYAKTKDILQTIKQECGYKPDLSWVPDEAPIE